MNLDDEILNEIIEEDLAELEETAFLMESDTFALHEEVAGEIEIRGSLRGTRIA